MAVDNRNFANQVHDAQSGQDWLMEDKRMSELPAATGKTGSQISTTTQYIPLQDTDGNLVKINPASFQEAVRNTLAGLLVNNDKGTTVSQIPAIASGDFGSVTPANLASVLGGMRAFEWTSGGFSAIDIEGFSFIHVDKDHNSDMEGMPFNYFNMIYAQLNIGNNQKNGIAIAVDNHGYIKYAHKWGLSAWSGWSEL